MLTDKEKWQEWYTRRESRFSSQPSPDGALIIAGLALIAFIMVILALWKVVDIVIWLFN